MNIIIGYIAKIFCYDIFRLKVFSKLHFVFLNILNFKSINVTKELNFLGAVESHTHPTLPFWINF